MLEKLFARKAQVHPVDLGDDLTVYVKELPASFFVEQQVAVANKRDGDYLEDRFGITRQIVLSLVDADGNRLLTEDDRGRVDELPRKDVLKLARAIMEANFEPPAEDGGDEKNGTGE